MKRELTTLPGGRVVDAVVGYRSWRVFLRDGRAFIMSLYNNVTWPGFECLERECLCLHSDSKIARHFAQAFGFEHTCGVYAWSEPRNRYGGAPGFIAGEVHLWGEVRVHQSGYRAEFARPSAFYVTEHMVPAVRTVVELAALDYGVPLVTNGEGR